MDECDDNWYFESGFAHTLHVLCLLHDGMGICSEGAVVAVDWQRMCATLLICVGLWLLHSRPQHQLMRQGRTDSMI